ncbi:unnamed protein product [Notodromas monacha]|uniref:Uncharacterized protein n=1 Tax=Notodromas monacha TaxID=399045 RepID=A0A7R9BJX2_9CRUS|nr:unnamed protein product [Notodromas monacha]CAG0916840.1 unnamed protein product [Notodromas monacha]
MAGDSLGLRKKERLGCASAVGCKVVFKVCIGVYFLVKSRRNGVGLNARLMQIEPWKLDTRDVEVLHGPSIPRGERRKRSVTGAETQGANDTATIHLRRLKQEEFCTIARNF